MLACEFCPVGIGSPFFLKFISKEDDTFWKGKDRSTMKPDQMKFKSHSFRSGVIQVYNKVYAG